MVSSAEFGKKSTKAAKAMRKRIPVVISDFILDCANEGKLLDFLEYEVGGLKDQFLTGKISKSMYATTNE